MLVNKCDICGGITEEGPASMMLFKGYREDFSSWADCTELNVKKQVSNRGGKVWDICGECLDKLRDYTESMSDDAGSVEDSQVTKPEMKRLYLVKFPESCKLSSEMRSAALSIMGVLNGGSYPRQMFETEALYGKALHYAYMVYACEADVWEACVEMTRLGINVSWSEMDSGYFGKQGRTEEPDA